MATFAQELKAIKEGTSLLRSETGGAEEKTYSFMQTGDVSRSESKSLEVVDVVRRRAQKEHSASLAQLASRIRAVFKFGAGAGEDPFEKVKGLITDQETAGGGIRGSESKGTLRRGDGQGQ